MYIQQQQRRNPILKPSGPLAPTPRPCASGSGQRWPTGREQSSTLCRETSAHIRAPRGQRGADVRKNSGTEGRVLPHTLGRRRDVGDPPPMRGSDRPLKISTSTISRGKIHAHILDIASNCSQTQRRAWKMGKRQGNGPLLSRRHYNVGKCPVLCRTAQATVLYHSSNIWTLCNIVALL